MKKLSMFLVALMLVMGFAGPASADFTQGSLVRVVYEKNANGKEVATDLINISSWTTPAAAPTNQVVGGGDSAWDLEMFGVDGEGNPLKNYDDLYVAYFSYVQPSADAWIGGSDDSQSSISRKWSNYSGSANSVSNLYDVQAPVGGSTVVVNSNNLNSFWYKFDKNGTAVGSYNDMIPAKDTLVNLAALETVGYVDQALFFYNTPDAAASGVTILTLRTMADGSTIINPSAVPIPGALVLLGSGLMGLVAVRRRSVQ